MDQLNVTEALSWTVRTAAVGPGMRLASSLESIWYERSDFRTGRRWIERLLSLEGSKDHELVSHRATLLNALGNFAYSQGDLGEAFDRYKESRRLRSRVGDRRMLAGSLNNLALIYRERGDYPCAERLLLRALVLNRQFGNKRWEARNLNNLGVTALVRGHPDDARDRQEQALLVAKQAGDAWDMAMASVDLGIALAQTSSSEHARQAYLDSLTTAVKIQNARGVATALRRLGRLSTKIGDISIAETQHKAALRLSMELADRGGIATSFQGLAVIANRYGHHEQAVRLLSAAATFRQINGFVNAVWMSEEFDRELNTARQSLRPEEFNKAWLAGEQSELDHLGNEILATGAPAIDDVVYGLLHPSSRTGHRSTD